MQESDIRPSHLSQKQAEAYRLDLIRYGKNLLEFKSRNCPGCGGDRNSMYLNHHQFIFVRCTACLCIFMSPGPTDFHVADLYANSEIYKYWADFMYPESRDSRLVTLHQLRVDWLLTAMESFLEPKKEYRMWNIFNLHDISSSTRNNVAVGLFQQENTR